MKKILISTLALFMLSSCSAPQNPAVVAPPVSTAPIHYVNDRFAFIVTVPSEFIAQGESDNGDGQAFATRNNRAEIRAWGGHLMEPEIECSANAMFADELPQPTYEHAQSGTSVVSGSIGGDIFYAKVIRTVDRCLGLTIKYPASEKAIYDPAVSTLAGSFKG